MRTSRGTLARCPPHLYAKVLRQLDQAVYRRNPDTENNGERAAILRAQLLASIELPIKGTRIASEAALL